MADVLFRQMQARGARREPWAGCEPVEPRLRFCMHSPRMLVTI
jgi:hypothetical protein